MTHLAVEQSVSLATNTQATHPLLSPSGKALLVVRTFYGPSSVATAAMDRITAGRVAATLEFLRNNLPETL